MVAEVMQHQPDKGISSIDIKELADAQKVIRFT